MDQVLDDQTLWSDDGYVTEIPYMRHYLRYQTPLTISFGAAINGFAAPDARAPFSYCDLGCGEAVTLLAFAVAYPHGTFVGVDMNPDHIASAQALADAAGLGNISFFCGTFDDFAAQNDAKFDFVAAHGVYSWVAQSVAQSLIETASSCLRDGGLFYFCHYVKPGGAKTETLFHLVQSLLARHTGHLSERAALALADLEALKDCGGQLFTDFPSLTDDIHELSTRDVRYLVHEYCNQYFRPKYFSEVVSELGALDMQFVGTTRAERYQTKNMLPEGKAEALAGLNLVDAEIRAGLLGNDAFRWDVFQKAAKAPANAPAIGDYILDSAVFPYGYKKELTLWYRETSFDSDVFRALIEPAHSGFNTIDRINADPKIAAFGADNVAQTLMDMLASRAFQPLLTRAHLPQYSDTKTFRLTHSFARKQFDRDFVDEGYVCFPSPISGSAQVMRGMQAMAAIYVDNASIPQALDRAWDDLTKMTPKQRRKIGAPAEVGQEFREDQSKRFRARTLPMLIKYGIIAEI